MALANYTDLKATIAAFLNRSDLTSVIPDFIALAEARLNRDLRLRMMESNESVVTVQGSRFVALPTGYLEPMALFIERATGREEIPFASSRMETTASQGEPRFYTVDGSNLAFDRPADQAYSLTFKMLKAFALSDSLPTNWLLTNYPDIYLAASLAEGFGYLMDDDALKWVARYQQTMTEVNEKEGRSKSQARLQSGLLPLLRYPLWNIVRGST